MMRKRELKRLKKAAGREKRRYVTGWKAATVIFLVVGLLFAPVSAGAQMYDNAVATRFGGTFWHLKNADENASFVTDQKLPLDSPKQLYTQLQAEAMVLLVNENALPLQAQAAVHCVAGSAVSAEKAGNLQTALTECGMTEGNGTTIVLLSQAEPSLLQDLHQKKSSGEIEKMILLWDTNQPVQPEVLKSWNADAVLWTGGADAQVIAEILAGTAPAGALSYTGAYGEYPAPTGSVYTGYKYYETRYEDYVMGAEKTGNFVYRDQVAYPFGFGLTYTSFACSDLQVAYDSQTDCFGVTVTVTNTGNTAAKEILQVYAQAPYTDYDKQYGVEKPAVQLVGFAKTELLEPGAAADITVQVDRRDLASYDACGAGTYILGAGDYYLTVATDAHHAINNILSAKGYTAENTEGRMDTDGDPALTYQWVQDRLDDQSYATAKNGGAISNRLPISEEQARISRQDWEGTLAKVSAPAQTALQYNPGDYATVPMPTLGAKNGLKLYNMKGLAFDDPKWQTLLDQMTFSEMARLMADAYGWTMPVGSVQAPGTRHGEYTYPIEQALLAATFDTRLIQDTGLLAGNNALLEKETVLFCNAYVLEDSFLAGKMQAAQVEGIQNLGVNAVLKWGNVPYSDEQAAREQLRALQYTLEENPTAGVVSVESVLAELMRAEWGSKGMVFAEKQPTPEDVLAGVTAFSVLPAEGMNVLATYKNDPVIVSAMRQACHDNLYALVNSAAMNGIGENTVVKVRMLPAVLACWSVVAVSAASCIVFAVFWSKGSKKWKRTQAYLDYMTWKNTLQDEKKEH